MNTRIPITSTILVVGVLWAAVPANAAICDLTTAGSSCTLATDSDGSGGVKYTNAIPQPTGTGFIDPFLRLQANGSEQGYNTSADYDPNAGGQQFQFDQKNPSFVQDPLLTSNFKGYTRDLALSEVPIVSMNGINYREFWLDINEPNGSKSLLSLDQLQIFLSPTAGLGTNTTGYSGGSLNGLNAIYSLDTGAAGTAGDNYVKMDYSLGSGSGSGDMAVYIPDSLFKKNGTGPYLGQYVYLYSQFGLQTCCDSGDGFEEWWVRAANGGGGGGGQSPVPEPASLLLVGTGLVVAANRLRKR